MKKSLILTVFKEEKTINNFLGSLLNQKTMPDELIITDGEVSGNTCSTISNYFTGKKLPLTLHTKIKTGNRSVGRNEAIKMATGDIILISDAGCELDNDWVEEIIKPFKDSNVDVVAGYYEGKAKTVFQKCLIPYVLVMSDKLNPDTFLPATRSMAIRKSVWKRAGGFDEELSHNEDYAFAKKLKKMGATMVFAKNAIVYWIPRDTLKEAYIMFRRFAQGDIEAHIYRPKVMALFLRYVCIISLLLFALIFQSIQFLTISVALLCVYILWSIQKNYRYVKVLRAFLLLPLLQFTSDFAVIDGSLRGLLSRRR